MSIVEVAYIGLLACLLARWEKRGWSSFSSGPLLDAGLDVLVLVRLSWGADAGRLSVGLGVVGWVVPFWGEGGHWAGDGTSFREGGWVGVRLLWIHLFGEVKSMRCLVCRSEDYYIHGVAESAGCMCV